MKATCPACKQMGELTAGYWHVIRPGLVKSEDPSRWNLFKKVELFQ